MNGTSTIRRRFSSLVTIGLVVLAGQSAHAFRFIPIRMVFTPTGNGSGRAFEVENDSDQPVAVQISMVTRSVDVDGLETYGDAENDFLIYPPQLALAAGQTQTIRVKWIGNPKPDRELAYRIIAEQLPVNLARENDDGAKINLIVRYLGAIYVTPKGARARIELDSFAAVRGADGSRRLVLVLHNKGSGHALLRNLRLHLSSRSNTTADVTTVSLNPEDLKGMDRENILPGHKRRFDVPWPDQLPDGRVDVRFEFDGAR